MGAVSDPPRGREEKFAASIDGRMVILSKIDIDP